jgi:hypothetical protein
VTFRFFQTTNTYLPTSNITEIRLPVSGEKFSIPTEVVILDTDSEVTELYGGNLRWFCLCGDSNKFV